VSSERFRLRAVSLSQQRRLEEKERRREEIIDAAERVLAARGFDAAKMEDIAREARVSRALVYTYFKDKNELSFALCERSLKLLEERFEGALNAQRRGIDQVAAIGLAYLHFAEEFPARFQLLSRFEAHRPAELDASGTERAVLLAGQCVNRVTVRALEQGMRDGSVRKDLGDPMLTALTLWGFSHGLIQLAQTKELVFLQENIAVSRFIEHSIALALRAVAA